MQTTLRAVDFIGSLGVDIHLQPLNSSDNIAKTAAVLDYLGIYHVRDAASWTLLEGNTIFQSLAQSGVKFDMLLPSGKDPVETISRIAAFAHANPGAVAAIEGPNEINHWPVEYAGLTGVAAGVAFVNAAANAAEATPILNGVDIYDLTGAPRTAAVAGDASDYVNIHPYPKLGAQPYDALATAMAQHGVAGKGMVITEAGYHTGIGNASWEGVDETTQAKLTLNLIADATRLGVGHIYLYQLLDSQDATGIDVDKNLGLFDTAFKPKTVATAIHNLTTILADDTANASSFATHALSFKLSGQPANSNSLVIEKAGGVHDLVLWAEPDIWNEIANKPIAVTAKQTTIDFGRLVDVTVYDPLVSDRPIARYENVTGAKIALSDHPVVIEVSGAADGPLAGSTHFDPALWLTGGAAADVIAGQSNDDTLKGMAGNDRIDGGAGDDTLIGGVGADRLVGGSGADFFLFQTVGESRIAATGRDEIVDFNAAEGDRLDLSRIDANSKVVGNQAFTLGDAAFSHVAGELIQTQVGDQWLLQGDLNGDARADFAILFDHLTQPVGAEGFLL